MNCPGCRREAEGSTKWHTPSGDEGIQVRMGWHQQTLDCMGEDKPVVAWSEVRPALSPPQGDLLAYGGSDD